MTMRNLVLCFFIIFCLQGFAQVKRNHNADSSMPDTLSKKQVKKVERADWRSRIRENHSQFFLKGNYVWAQYETNITTKYPGSIFSATIGLEEHLELPDQQAFLTTSFLGRFSPGSGIYVEYYGLKRNKSFTTTKELVFFEDTIPAGTTSGTYFNTQVFSAGYLLSVLKKSEAFLGIYFNVYLMNLNTGVYSDFKSHESSLNMSIPFPNIGLVTALEIREWLYFGANVGVFVFQLEDLNQSLYDFNIELSFRPNKWLGISVSYKEFDVQIKSTENAMDVLVDYNFKGPSLGLSLSY